MSPLKRLLVGLVAASFAFMLTAPAKACSAKACSNDGVEMMPDFVVEITHAGKPLSGVTVDLAGPVGASGARKFSVKTDSDGIAHVTNLLPGLYWLDAEFLGIGATYDCFHVKQAPTKGAKSELAFDWGDSAPQTRRIAGKFVDTQPGKGGTFIENIVHRVDVPIPGVTLTLHSATTEAVYHATSDANGAFTFDGIPDGTYVLHIDAGIVEADREYEASDQLIALDSTARPGPLLFKRVGPGCGGPTLELQQ